MVWKRLVLIAFLALATPAAGQTSQTPDQLIDQLTQIDCNAPGLYEHWPWRDFWAVEPDPYSDLHQQKPDCMPQAMRALVRLGAEALPALVRHIEDARPTRLKIGGKWEGWGPGGQFFAEEYDSRAHHYHAYVFPSSFRDSCDERDCITRHGFHEPYTIRIGDVCFSLIGQIVNRYMVAAHFQPSIFVLVNSPLEAPSLAARVRADWGGAGAEDLRTSLLADLHMAPDTSPAANKPPAGFKFPVERFKPPEELQSLSLRSLYAGALRRLRFYYPETYAALTGDDLVKKQNFVKDEADERAGKAGAPKSGD